MRFYIKKTWLVYLILILLSTLSFAYLNEISHDSIVSNMVIELQKSINQLNPETKNSQKLMKNFENLNRDSRNVDIHILALKESAEQLSKNDGALTIIRKIQILTDSLNIIFNEEDYFENLQTLARGTARPYTVADNPYFTSVPLSELAEKSYHLNDINIKHSDEYPTPEDFLNSIHSIKTLIEKDIFSRNINKQITKIKFNKKVTSGVFLDKDNKFYIPIDKSSEILFSTPFSDENEIKLDDFENKIPLTAKKANNMPVGETVIIPTQLTLVNSSSAGYGGIISNSSDAFYIINGKFKIVITKLHESYVKVTLINNQKNNLDIAGLKYFLDSDNNIKDTIFKPIPRADLNNDNFSISYVFNLAYDEAQNAYEKILNPSTRIKRNIYDNFAESTGINQNLLSNLIYAEDIYQTDRGILPQNRRINRKFDISLDNHYHFDNPVKLHRLINENSRLFYEISFYQDNKEYHLTSLNYNVSRGDLRDINTVEHFDVTSLFRKENNNLIHQKTGVSTKIKTPRITPGELKNRINYIKNISEGSLNKTSIQDIWFSNDGVRNFKLNHKLFFYNDSIDILFHLFESGNNKLVYDSIIENINSINYILKNEKNADLYNNIDEGDLNSGQRKLYNHFKKNNYRFKVFNNLFNFASYFGKLNKYNEYQKFQKITLLMRNPVFRDLIPAMMTHGHNYGKMDYSVNLQISGYGITNLNIDYEKEHLFDFFIKKNL
ncbi:MAG: hypothetical protein ACQESP_08580 [Candidatus Muiribacteriota bacterium]